MTVVYTLAFGPSASWSLGTSWAFFPFTGSPLLLNSSFSCVMPKLATDDKCLSSLSCSILVSWALLMIISSSSPGEGEKGDTPMFCYFYIINITVYSFTNLSHPVFIWFSVMCCYVNQIMALRLYWPVIIHQCHTLFNISKYGYTFAVSTFAIASKFSFVQA